MGNSFMESACGCSDEDVEVAAASLARVPSAAGSFRLLIGFSMAGNQLVLALRRRKHVPIAMTVGCLQLGPAAALAVQPGTSLVGCR